MHTLTEWIRRVGLTVGLAFVVLACGHAATEVASQQPAAEGDVVLAEFEWNGQKHQITLAEMEAEIADLPEYRRDDYEGPEGRKEYLTLMAESRLLLEYARDLGYEQDPEIERKVEQYRRQRMLDAITDHEVESQITVTDEDVQQYYEEHKEDFWLPERIRLKLITVTNRELAEQVLEEIQSGKTTLDKRAAELSAQNLNVGPGGGNDGDTGLFARDTFEDAEPFVEKAFSMQVGEMTDEIFTLERRGQTYYMIWRVDERAEPRQMTLEEVERRIRRTVNYEKRNARKAEWEAQLREVAQLSVYEDRVPEPSLQENGSLNLEAPFGESPDLGLILAEYNWGGQSYQFTLADLLDRYRDLTEYRKTRLNSRERWIEFLNEQLTEALKVHEAKDLGYGYTEEDERRLQEYRHQLMVEKLVREEVDEKISYTEEDLQAYYEEHRDEYIEPEKVRLTCITLTDREEAEKLLEEIKNGRDIVEAARTYSEMGKNAGPGVGNYGDTGLFDRSTYGHAKEFTEAAFSLAVGEITPEVVVQPLQDQTYYMIFRVEEKQPQRYKTLDEVRRQVERAVEKVKKRERLQEWLAGLKEKANLQIYYDRLPQEVGQAEEGASSETSAEATTPTEDAEE
ncbi:MAG: hypothetical protein KatS3mg115_0521 [Candidatus Poribacteria bacterium]|nr:MAG: hypothetical protein KatS3mg115_0521 [Candidatus Poribacteria bacterium]